MHLDCLNAEPFEEMIHSMDPCHAKSMPVEPVPGRQPSGLLTCGASPHRPHSVALGRHSGTRRALVGHSEGTRITRRHWKTLTDVARSGEPRPGRALSQDTRTDTATAKAKGAGHDETRRAFTVSRHVFSCGKVDGVMDELEGKWIWKTVRKPRTDRMRSLK